MLMKTDPWKYKTFTLNQFSKYVFNYVVVGGWGGMMRGHRHAFQGPRLWEQQSKFHNGLGFQGPEFQLWFWAVWCQARLSLPGLLFAQWKKKKMKSQLIFVPGQVGRAIQALFNSFSQQPSEVSRRIAPFYRGGDADFERWHTCPGCHSW